jgi:phosphoribosylamine--glycine ligase
MKILIVGSGGREHALAWKCAQSQRVNEVIVAPGNAGTAREAGVRNVNIAAGNIDALLDFARDNAVDLTIVGPEVPLVDGIVDHFSAAGLRCFGPRAAAARLEGSKAFTKDFLRRHEIPTAEYRNFDDLDAALDYIRENGAPIVIKADGLAAGKGVVVAGTVADAEDAVHGMLADGSFGEAGSRVVIEEYLEGEEASFIVVTDGVNVLPLASSQDHKARDEGDTGPNTGGMGAYSPAPVVTPAMQERILETIIRPTLSGLHEDGITYTGFLYAGLMITPEGQPKVIEFNCRMGDPETQPIMARLDADLVAICDAALDAELAGVEANWDPRAALGVVMAAGGYPGSYAKGAVISGLDKELADSKVFHAGTATDGDRVVTAGGRVLCVVGLGDTVSAARDAAYARVASIDWDGAYFRRDIGHRAIAREKA